MSSRSDFSLSAPRHSCISISEVRSLAQVDTLIMPLMEAAHVESRYAVSSFNHVRCRKYYQHTVLADPDHYALVSVSSASGPVGFLQLGCSYLYWTEIRVAVISLLFTLPEFRRTLAGARALLRLLEFAAQWSRRRRIDEIQIQVTSGTRLRAIDRAVRRMGFDVVGGNYVWSLPSS